MITIVNRGSLMTIAGTNTCLGYLMNFTGHGIYEPSLGKVDVTPEEADVHNKLLSQAEIDGLDKNCQVGQYGRFYFSPSKKTVQTFIGTVVSDNVIIHGQSISFTRNGKTFRGKKHEEDDIFTFKRIA
jgi:hypothetical protein